MTNERTLSDAIVDALLRMYPEMLRRGPGAAHPPMKVLLGVNRHKYSGRRRKHRRKEG